MYAIQSNSIKINMSGIFKIVILGLIPLTLLMNYFKYNTFLINLVVLTLGCYSILRLLLIRGKSPTFWFWLLFLIINFSYFLLYPSYGPEQRGLSSFGKMASILLSMLFYFIFYYAATKGIINDNNMKHLFIVILTLSIYIH